MKRVVITLAIGVAVFASVYGFAASLGVSSETLGAGSTAVAACRAAACGSKAIRVTLTGPGASNASLAEQAGTTPSSGSTQGFNFSGISASDVTGVHVVISG
jgi:hypothetical protein